MTMMPSIFGEDLFDDWMDFPFGGSFFNKQSPLFGKGEKNLLKTDVKETESSYILDMDLPEYKKDEVSAKLENGYLIISAVKNENQDEKDKDGHYIRRERYSGHVSRSFYVGDSVKQSDIQARFEDGILKLSIPKKAPDEIEQEHYIAIEG